MKSCSTASEGCKFLIGEKLSTTLHIKPHAMYHLSKFIYTLYIDVYMSCVYIFSTSTSEKKAPDLHRGFDLRLKGSLFSPCFS